MIVLDTSAMVEALVGAEPSEVLLNALAGEIHAPHLLDAEVAATLRAMELDGTLTEARARQAIVDHWSFGIVRHPHEPLRDRMWDLRHQYPSQGAAFIALAEALGAPLVTCDATLARGGHDAEVVVVVRQY